MNSSEFAVKKYSYKCAVATKILKATDLLTCILQMPDH